MTEQCSFGLIVLKAELQSQQDILDHGNGRICNLSIKVIGLAPSQTQQLFCLLKKDLHGPADLVNFNHPDERQTGISSDKHPPFTITSLPAEEHFDRHSVVFYHCLLVMELQLPAPRGIPQLIADLAMCE